jgi:hypothetical protein
MPIGLLSGIVKNNTNNILFSCIASRPNWGWGWHRKGKKGLRRAPLYLRGTKAQGEEDGQGGVLTIQRVALAPHTYSD